VARHDPFVSPNSAGGFSELDEIRYVDCGHAIAPVELQQPLFEYLDAHCKPAAILEQIARLNDEDRLHAYCQLYMPLAEDAIRGVLARAHRREPQDYVSALASTMLRDFPGDFARRPLRKLTFEEALSRYVTRRAEAAQL